MPTSSVIRMSGLAFWIFWMVCANCETPSGMNSSPTISPPCLLDDLADPFGRDLAEIVVGRDGVDLLAEFLHHPGDQGRELLLRHRPGHDHVAVADTALILVVVERQPVELVDDRPIGLARGAGEAGEHDVDLVALQHPAHEFLVARVVRLSIVDHEVDRPARDAARLVDLVRGELDAVDLADRRQREVARLVFEHPDLDRRGRARARRAQEQRRRDGHGGGPHCVSMSHRSNPRLHVGPARDRWGSATSHGAATWSAPIRRSQMSSSATRLAMLSRRSQS